MTDRRRYETPEAVAAVLARHAPRHIKALLDPAVGGGALLGPLVSRLAASNARVVCLDVDSDVLKDVGRHYGKRLGESMRLLNEDFLEWALTQRRVSQRFDCVVMNPPFCGKRASLVRLQPGVHPFNKFGNKYMPVEAAFVLHGIRLLNPGGRLLAVLPPSLVTAEGCSWIRRAIMACGAITYVHELPRRTFQGVESRMYLFVFERNATQGIITLCNHDLVEPERISVAADELCQARRLDFGFCNTVREFNKLIAASPGLNWIKLSELASVVRGAAESPRGRRTAIHTTDYRNGFWRVELRHTVAKQRRSDHHLRPGDILIKRVGRSLSSSVGLATMPSPVRCTDCVLIIRPNQPEDSDRLLFSLRSLLRHGSGQLLERGTGAAYLTTKGLLNLIIPWDLALFSPREFRTYCAAVARRAARELIRIESGMSGILWGARA